jgi:hypothetical protein
VNLTPADIESIASAVVAKLRGPEGVGSFDPPISPAELARKRATVGKSVLVDFNGGKQKGKA